MTIQQVSIAFAKYITGYRPGDDGWSPEDEQAYKFALCDEAFTEGDKKTEQQVKADEIDNMPDACKKCGNRGYDVCPATNCQFHSLT